MTEMARNRLRIATWTSKIPHSSSYERDTVGLFPKSGNPKRFFSHWKEEIKQLPHIASIADRTKKHCSRTRQTNFDSPANVTGMRK